MCIIYIIIFSTLLIICRCAILPCYNFNFYRKHFTSHSQTLAVDMSQRAIHRRDAPPRNGCCFERFGQRSRRIEIRVNQSAAKFEPPVYYIGKLLPFPAEFDLSLSAAHYYRAVLDVVAVAAAYRVRVSPYLWKTFSTSVVSCRVMRNEPWKPGKYEC